MLPTNLRDQMFSAVSLRTLRYVHPTPPSEAKGLLGRVYGQIERDFMFGGPLLVHAPAPTLAAGAWMFGREANLVVTALDRASKEAIATAVAVTNRCPYCVDLHTSLTHAGQRHEVAAAIRKGRGDRLDDPYWAALVDWAMATRTPGAAILRAPPFTAEQLPEAVGNAFFFHYINRVVNVLFDGTALGEGNGVGKGLMLRLFGAELREHVNRELAPGDSLALLPPADLPASLAWAEGQPILADALARWSQSLERDTDTVLPATVKDVVGAAVDGWRGEDPPLSRGWVEPHVQRLPPGQGAVARLALLTALDSHRVVDDDVAPVLASGGERALVQVIAWAAFAAATRVGQWLVPRTTDSELATKTTMTRM